MENLPLRLLAPLLPILLISLGSLPRAHATSFAPRPFEDSVKDAPHIVRGKIGTSYADWAKGGDGVRRIYTFYELQLTEVFKGNVNSSIRSLIVREVGGQKDGVGLEVAGTAKFNRGEDVVIYMGDRNPDGSYEMRGMMMGKYNVERDADGKEFLTGAGLSGAGDGHDDHSPVSDGSPGHDDSAQKKWTLESLRQLIASQASTSQPESNNAANPGVSSTPSPSISPSANAGLEAPQLQPILPQGASGNSPNPQVDTTGESRAPERRSLALGILLGIAALGALGLILRRLLR